MEVVVIKFTVKLIDHLDHPDHLSHGDEWHTQHGPGFETDHPVNLRIKLPGLSRISHDDRFSPGG